MSQLHSERSGGPPNETNVGVKCVTERNAQVNAGFLGGTGAGEEAGGSGEEEVTAAEAEAARRQEVQDICKRGDAIAIAIARGRVGW